MQKGWARFVRAQPFATDECKRNKASCERLLDEVCIISRNDRWCCIEHGTPRSDSPEVAPTDSLCGRRLRPGPQDDLLKRVLRLAITDADGRYTVGPLAAGTYRPVVYVGYGAGPWAPQWSGGSTTYEGATAVTLKPGRAGTFSAALAPASSIAGELVESDGSPAGEGWIGFVESTTGRHMGDFDVFGGNTFSPVTLPAGQFRIRLENVYTGEKAWYDGSSTEEGSTVVTLQEGEARSLTIHLPASAG